jgi:hypothetical protein
MTKQSEKSARSLRRRIEELIELENTHCGAQELIDRANWKKRLLFEAIGAALLRAEDSGRAGFRAEGDLR